TARILPCIKASQIAVKIPLKRQHPSDNRLFLKTKILHKPRFKPPINEQITTEVKTSRRLD
ncbi:MAG: hypothetical protein ACRDBQ_22450, partial [Shewanella sp.]